MGILRTAGERIHEYKGTRLQPSENVAISVNELVSDSQGLLITPSPPEVTDAVVRDRCPTPQSSSQCCKPCPEKNLPDSKAGQLERPLCYWGLPVWTKQLGQSHREKVFGILCGGRGFHASACLGRNGVCSYVLEKITS